MRKKLYEPRRVFGKMYWPELPGTIRIKPKIKIRTPHKPTRTIESKKKSLLRKVLERELEEASKTENSPI